MSHGARRNVRGAGFTLLELLVVLIILGLLASIAAPQVLKHLGRAKTDTAKLQVNNLSVALDHYALQLGRYPTQEEGLRALIESPPNMPLWDGPYLRKADSLVDPWGSPFIYRSPGEHGEYDLYTLGRDGGIGGDGEDQDVTSW